MVVTKPNTFSSISSDLITPTSTDLKKGKLATAFTGAKVQPAGARRFNFSLVAKFTTGKPSLADIQRAFQSHWHIKGRATTSEIWDNRHVLVILEYEEDISAALANTFRKLGHEMIHVFRWSMD